MSPEQRECLVCWFAVMAAVWTVVFAVWACPRSLFHDGCYPKGCCGWRVQFHRDRWEVRCAGGWLVWARRNPTLPLLYWSRDADALSLWGDSGVRVLLWGRGRRKDVSRGR